MINEEVKGQTVVRQHVSNVSTFACDVCCLLGSSSDSRGRASLVNFDTDVLSGLSTRWSASRPMGSSSATPTGRR